MFVVETERSIDHTGSEKTPVRIVQQWGILVNGLTAEPATWRNESYFFIINKKVTCLTKSYKILDKADDDNFISIGLDQILCQQSR